MDQRSQREPLGPDGTILPPEWGVAYKRYLRFWVNLARTLKLPPEEAKDVVHSVIATILANERIQFVSVEHLRNYVAKSILNRAVQTKRRNDKTVRWEEPVELQFAVQPDADKIDRELFTAALREALMKLSERDFRMIKLRYFSGLRFAEISSMLKVPISTLKSREDHALKLIREWLSKRGIRGGER
jgi:RNA polymerase sigma factor (sigma-70 family)